MSLSLYGRKSPIMYLYPELCKELGITRPTLYRYIGPNGELRDFGNRVLSI